MTVERSERGVLTTNADYNEIIPWYLNKKISTPNQWSQIDNYTISYRFNGELPYGPSGYIWQRPEFMTFSGYSSLNYELIYSVTVWYYNTSTKQFESAWYDNNTKIQINGDMEWSDSPNLINSYEVYVRRKDGSALSRQDMQPCVAVVSGSQARRIAYTTPIPNEWVTGTAGTYTTDISTMTTVVPIICDIDDTDFNAFIDIPNKIVAGINLCIVGIGSLLNLKYVSFMICFVLIVGLIAWLIH